MADDGWEISLDPPVLLPGRRFTARLTYTPTRDHDARDASVTLRCVERYRYDQTQTSTGANGQLTSRRVTRTGVEELHRLAVRLDAPARFVAGQGQSWDVDFEVPPLGPASFEGEELRCDWTLEAKVDIPMSPDQRSEHTVHVAQPTALLRAGVVATGQYGLFEDAPANVDAFPAQIRLEPVPVCLMDPYSGTLTIETPQPIEVQEVRLELRVKVQVTVSGGHSEEINVGVGRLDVVDEPFGGAFARHGFHAEAADVWLPSIDLPHGRARGEFHVILALAWRPDIHYLRDVALATTTQL